MAYPKFADARDVFDNWKWEYVEDYYPNYSACSLITVTADMDLSMDNADHAFDFSQHVTPAALDELQAVSEHLAAVGENSHDIDVPTMMAIWRFYADNEVSFFDVRNSLYTYIWLKTLQKMPYGMWTPEQKQWFLTLKNPMELLEIGTLTNRIIKQ